MRPNSLLIRVLCAFFSALLCATKKAEADDERDKATTLLNYMFSGYDRRIRPFANRNKPVIVEMTIVLAILTELRENQQVASFVISHHQKWVDPDLAWDPAEFGGLKQIVVPQSMVWVPKLFIYNSMDTKEMLSENRFDIRITNRGRLKMNIPQYVTCICRLNIELFPFDTQFCAIALASPLLNTSEMSVVSKPPPKDSYFSGNAEWEVTNVTVRHMKFQEDGEFRAEAHFIIHLHRRPIYYITVIVAPTFLISALSILGIFSPNSNDGPRNEKVSLGLGSLLAMSVLLDIVSTAMPKSNSIPLLGYYIMTSIILCAIAVGVSMTLLAISRQLIQSNQLPSESTYRILFMRSSKTRASGFWKLGESGYSNYMNTLYMNCNGTTQNGVEPSTENNNGTSVSLLKIPGFFTIYNRVREIAEAQMLFREKLEKRKWRSLVRREWNRVFTRFDYAFLFIFSAINLGALLYFLQFSWLPIPALPEDPFNLI